MNNANKRPVLTREEWDFFQREEETFFKKYNLDRKIPYAKRIAHSLQDLAVAKLLGVGYRGIYEKNKEEAVRHHLKARDYDPSIANKFPNFRKMIAKELAERSDKSSWLKWLSSEVRIF